MSSINITKLAGALLGEEAKGQSDLGFLASANAFFEQIGTFAPIGVYLGSEEKHSEAVTARAACLIEVMEAIISRARYQGEFVLICNLSNQALKEELGRRLPFFQTGASFGFRGCQVTVADVKNISSVKACLLLCGSGDTLLAQSIPGLRYILPCFPYLLGEMSEMCIREPKRGEWLHLFPDAMSLNQMLSLRPYLQDLKQMKAVPPEEKAWWEKSYANLSICEELFQRKDKVTVVTVLGIGSKGGMLDRGDNMTLLFTLALLEWIGDGDRPVVLVFPDYQNQEDSHFELLKLFCDNEKNVDDWQEALSRKYPHADSGQLKEGIIDPLCQKQKELGEKRKKLRWAEGAPDALEKGTVTILPLGKLPACYEKALAAYSDFLFLGRQEYANLAVNLGIPYLIKPLEADAENYPDLQKPGTARRFEKLSGMFAYDIGAYTSALEKNLCGQIGELAGFFAVPETEYFSSIGQWAQDELNDKLSAVAGLLMDSKAETETGSDGFMSKSSRLQELFDELRKDYQPDEATVNLTRALHGMRAADYLKGLSGGEDFVVCLKSIDNIKMTLDQGDGGDPPENPDIYGVEVQDAQWKEGSLCLKLTDWYGGSCLNTYLNGAFTGTAGLFGIPWLTLEDCDFSVTIPENDAVIKGSVGGTLTGTKLHLTIDLNSQDGKRRIMAHFKTPETAMDIFYGIAGGLDFLAAMPEPLKKVSGFGLSDLEFYYDEKNSSISAMEFCLETDAPWTLWERDGRALLTAAPVVRIRVCDPANITTRQVWAAVSALVGMGEEGQAGELWLSGSYPPFIAELRLSSEKISLSTLLEMFDVHAEFNSDITDLRIFGDFGNKSFQLSAAVEADWEIIKGQFTVTGLGFCVSDIGGTFSAAFAGSVLICNQVSMGAVVAYQAGGWTLQAKAAMGTKVKMNDLLSAYHQEVKGYLEEDTDNPLVASLAFELTKPAGEAYQLWDKSEADSGCQWEISAKAENWHISVIDMTVDKGAAAVGMKDGSFYASLTASLRLLGADFLISLRYEASGKQFFLKWGDISGLIESKGGETTATLTLNNFSLGEIIETFTGWLTGASFALDSPWDLLNQWKVEKMDLVYNFTKSVFFLAIKAGLDLGFASVEEVKVVYDKKAREKICVELKGKFAWQQEDVIRWDASQPGTAPAPDGKGGKYLDLRLLAFGQRMELLPDSYLPATVDDVVHTLEESLNPDEPPRYSPRSGWLVAADFGILKDKSNHYFLDVALVFYDPSLFALRVKLDGSAAKILAGFSFEIIYGKLSETLGIYKGTVTLPDRLRRFDLGAYMISLPDFYAEVYTNGDFKVDVGFPKNGDFSRSFTLEGIIPPGIPVTGSCGLYFGRLSSASASSSGIHLPRSNAGIFNPAIVYGMGIRFGVGKSISYGILSGGFSVTLTAILEGVTAKWCPYDARAVSEDTQWYWYLNGSASVIGNIYGKIDFAIICASVNVLVGVTVGFEYETCRAVYLTISAQVQASASLVINFGIFKINISFKFQIQVKEGFRIGSDSPAPWDENRIAASPFLFGYRESLSGPPVMNFSNLQNKDKKTELPALMALSVSAAADEWGGSKTYITGNVILTLKDQDGGFRALAETVLLWVLAAGLKREYTCGELKKETVSDGYLADLEAYLNDNRLSRAPLPYEELQSLLTRFFIIRVLDNGAECAALEAENRETNSGVWFPVPPQVFLETETGGLPGCSYKLSEYNSLTEQALDVIREIFDQMAVTVEDEQKQMTCRGQGQECSVAQWVFCDWFLLAARQGIRGMRKVLRDLGQEQAEIGAVIKGLYDDGFYNGLSGMLSRYNLHGLRLPTCDQKTGEPFINPQKEGIWVRKDGDGRLTLPGEAGLYALAGLAFHLPDSGEQEFVIKPSFGSGAYLEFPEGFCLSINDRDGSGAMVKDLAEFLKSSHFQIDCQLQRVQAHYKPAEISFAEPATQEGITLWELPLSLTSWYQAPKRAYPEFKLSLTSSEQGEVSRREEEYAPLTLVTFSLEETEAEGAYRILGGAAQDSPRLLALIQAAAREPSILVSAFVFGGSREAFLAVSQLDLSTETRPFEENGPEGQEPEEQEPGQGLLSMLTVLWKAMTVNNGGYVLTYRDGGRRLGPKAMLAIELKQGAFSAAGCPMLVNGIYSRTKPGAGEVMTATADPYKLRADATGSLRSFLEGYCCDIHSFADLNREIVLNPKTPWQISGAVYQARAGIEPGLLLAEVAAYFTVTVEQIIKANPQVALGDKLADGQAIHIPEFLAYARNGDTLHGFSSRYFMDPSLLLWENQDRDDLFAPSGTGGKIEVSVSVCAGELLDSNSQNTASCINESYLISRQSPPDLLLTDAAGSARSILENLYSLLRYGVRDTGDFKESGYSMPSAPDDQWRYHMAMPVGSLYGGYEAVGRLLQNRFQWVDLFGNCLPDEFLSSCRIGYQDELLGLSRWQSVSAKWDMGSRGLIITLTFAAEDYLTQEPEIRASVIGGASNMLGSAQTAASFYDRLLCRLEDERVQFALICSFLADQKRKIEKEEVISWLKGIRDFLKAITQETQSACKPEPLILEVSVSAPDFVQTPLTAISMEWLTKREGPAAPGYHGVEAVLLNQCMIPLTDDKKAFAAHLAYILPSYGLLQSGKDASLYMFNKASLSMETTGEAAVYLPLPVSNVPENRDGVEIFHYESGTGFGEAEKRNYRDVDLNLWLEAGLELLDRAFSCVTASGARIAGADYDGLLEKKKALAKRLSERLMEAYAPQENTLETGDEMEQEVREQFLQRLLSKLSNYFRVRAIAALPVFISGPRLECGSCRLYGKLELPDEEKQPEIALSSPKLKLSGLGGAEKQNLVFAVMGPDMVLDKTGAVLPSLKLPLSYRATHMEQEIVPALDGFEQSDWLGGVDKEIARFPLCQKEDVMEIPLPLYAFPETPAMECQEQEMVSAFEWKYSFTYSRTRHYPQASCHCKVRYNVEYEAFWENNGEELFGVLAQLDSAGKEVLADLEESARRLHSQETASEQDKKIFLAAFQCVDELLDRLVNVPWAQGAEDRFSNTGCETTFQVTEGVLESGDLSLAIQGGSEEIQEIIPEIEGYTSVRAEENHPVWVFEDRQGKRLSAAIGQGIRRRRFQMPPKKLLSCHNAIAEIYVEQNRMLCQNKKMQDCFVFTTGAASFDKPFAALHERKDSLDLAQYLERKGERHPVYEYLEAFFREALAGSEKLCLAALAAYAGSVYPGLPRVVQPIFSQSPVTIGPDELAAVIGREGSWMKTLREWRAGFPNKKWEKDEKLMFSFSFFSIGDGTQTPVLIMQEVYLEGDRVLSIES